MSARDHEVDWTRRLDVDVVVSDAILRWHPDLKKACILGVGRPTCATKGGREVWGSLKKASPLERALAADPNDDALADYLLIVGLDVWLTLTPRLRLALIDHELHHADYDDENERWIVRGHDLEEFTQVVQRHGAWKSDVESFLRGTRTIDPSQGALPLPGVEGA